MKFKIVLVLSLLMILWSCSTVKISPDDTIISPQKFSLLDSSSPESSYEYLARMEKYDNILKASPVPVYVLSSEDFASNIFLKIGNRYPIDKISRINILGMYFYGQKIKGFPGEFIFINKDLTPEQIVVTYFHELGHYLHRIKGCELCANNPVIREMHALYNELTMGWDYDVPMVLESSIRTMALYAIDKDANMTYRMATFEIMETDLFKQTMRYLISLEKGSNP